MSAYHEIKAVPAPLHYILHEASNNLLSTETETIQVSSNVPLTVKRYYDDLFIPGQEPIKSNCKLLMFLFVVVVDNCVVGYEYPTNLMLVLYNIAYITSLHLSFSI